MIQIQIPATSANIGPGFDSLGLALRLYNRVWMEERAGAHIVSLDGAQVPTGEDNLIYRTAAHLYALCGRPFRGLSITQENNIPMTRGLGSSSACIVAGLLGANALLGNPLSTQEILDEAAALEGHPDNSTPAVLGGLTVAVLENKHVYSVKAPIGGKLRFAAFIPSFELRTEKARAALPHEVPHKDAVYNLSRAALMMASLLTGQTQNLRVAAGDRLHQPYRLALIPGAQDVFALCKRLGALAWYISGAGPTLMAMADAADSRFETRAREELRALHQSYQLCMFDCDETGATVCEAQVPART